MKSAWTLNFMREANDRTAEGGGEGCDHGVSRM